MVLMIQMIQKWFKISRMTKNSQNSKKFEKHFSNLSEFCEFFVILEILNHFWIMNTILKTHFEKNTDMVLIFIWKYLPRSWIDNSYNRTASEAWLAIKKRIKLYRILGQMGQENQITIATRDFWPPDNCDISFISALRPVNDTEQETPVAFSNRWAWSSWLSPASS